MVGVWCWPLHHSLVPRSWISSLHGISGTVFTLLYLNLLECILLNGYCWVSAMGWTLQCYAYIVPEQIWYMDDNINTRYVLCFRPWLLMTLCAQESTRLFKTGVGTSRMLQPSIKSLNECQVFIMLWKMGVAYFLQYKTGQLVSINYRLCD